MSTRPSTGSPRRAGFTIAVVLCVGIAQPASAQRVDWPTPSGDHGAMRYAPIGDIDRTNVTRLAVAWRWRTGERDVAASAEQKAARPGLFHASPVVIGDTLYVSTPYAAVALDARTGRELWKYDPEVWRMGPPSHGIGFVHRGVATWTSPRERRIFINARWKLIAIHAATGRPIPTLGELAVPPGNRVEALKGARHGQHSIRINEQYRICFRWEEGYADDVEVTDYHQGAARDRVGAAPLANPSAAHASRRDAPRGVPQAIGHFPVGVCDSAGSVLPAPE